MTNLIEANTNNKFKFFPARFLSGDIFSSIIHVTPEIAAHILQFCNGKNRAISTGNVGFIARQMEEGVFNGLNGETLVVDNEGNLRDGQHRLMAIISANVSLDMMFIFNTMPEAILTIDTGRNRNLGDVLSFTYPSKYIRTVAASVLFVMKYERGSYASDAGNKARYKIDNTMGVEFIKKKPNFISFIEEAMRLYANGDKLLPPAHFCSMYWIINNLSENNTVVDDFFYKLSTGIGIQNRESAVYTLRKLLTEARTNKEVRARGLSPRQKVQAVTQMWNKFVQGKPITKVYLSSDWPKIIPAT